MIVNYDVFDVLNPS